MQSVAAAPEARHFIIAHSHGGNVALDARQAMSGNALNVHMVWARQKGVSPARILALKASVTNA
jgi:hypothetical protein